MNYLDLHGPKLAFNIPYSLTRPLASLVDCGFFILRSIGHDPLCP